MCVWSALCLDPRGALSASQCGTAAVSVSLHIGRSTRVVDVSSSTHALLVFWMSVLQQIFNIFALQQSSVGTIEDWLYFWDVVVSPFLCDGYHVFVGVLIFVDPPFTFRALAVVLIAVSL